MNLKDLSEVDIISLQYSLLEELKQKKTQSAPVITAEITTNSANEFIRQRFTDENGNKETPSNHLNRMRWFELGCPRYKQLADYYNLKHGVIRKTASRFKWKEIQSEAMKLGWRPNNSKEFIDNSKVERNSKEYNRYHEKVLKRDRVCQCCGSKNDLEVHHPMPFNQYNSLGADTNNGIVLCKGCHSEYHSQFGKKERCSPVTLAQFLRDYGMSTQSYLEVEE